MSEITPLVNRYCQNFKQKELLRKQSSEVSKELKESHEKLRSEMSRADLRIIRSISNGYDIKVYQKLKKPTSSVKNLKTTLSKYNIPEETIADILKDIQTGKEETTEIIRLIPLRTKNESPVIT